MRGDRVPTNILFATKTCPKCVTAARILDQYRIPFVKVFAEDDMDQAIAHDVRQVPTLVLTTGEKIIDLVNIIKYAEAKGATQ